jgi:hypothetical protein
VGSLYDALVGIDQGLADESILDKYSDIRRQKYQEIVDPMSTSNFRRLWEKDPETTIAEDDFFKILRMANEDEALLSQLREVRKPHSFQDESNVQHLLTATGFYELDARLYRILRHKACEGCLSGSLTHEMKTGTTGCRMEL